MLTASDAKSHAIDNAKEEDCQLKKRLEARASRRYAWHYEKTAIAGVERQFATATRPDELLLDACNRQEAGERVEDPYWAAVWQAAVGLDWYMETLDLRGLRVLELGAGTGRAGIAACLRGADVTVTDGMTDPLLLAALSGWGLSSLRVRRLRWGDEQIRGPAFDLILGSDVTYNRALWPLLETSMKEHLAPRGKALLSDPERLISNEFSSWVTKAGWLYGEHFVPHCQDETRQIRIMELQLS